MNKMEILALKDGWNNSTYALNASMGDLNLFLRPGNGKGWEDQPTGQTVLRYVCIDSCICL